LNLKKGGEKETLSVQGSRKVTVFKSIVAGLYTVLPWTVRRVVHDSTKGVLVHARLQWTGEGGVRGGELSKNIKGFLMTSFNTLKMI